ncbi:hypothetical protein G4G27_00660 [Sphingomonas sp. So64.6b]|uniref:hypothetical protein n=1 Tax=Sphingomonas sp. So64.6b TaxID=2997354 RepID=UPI0015FF4332|nr:hypothetical protein [Sphingomonas sp. So64.6b]QNA82681.1 hypothetical protein G4G27_00660 [Sphingomonas sp. So64.6b]
MRILFAALSAEGHCPSADMVFSAARFRSLYSGVMLALRHRITGTSPTGRLNQADMEPSRPMISAPALSRYSRKARAKFPLRRADFPAVFPVDSRKALEKAFPRKTSRSCGKIGSGVPHMRAIGWPPIQPRPCHL